MVVTFILLGTVTKLALAIAATQRSRFWWTPGTLAMGLGIVESTLPSVPRSVGEGTVMLGACAVVIARLLRPAVASGA